MFVGEAETQYLAEKFVEKTPDAGKLRVGREETEDGWLDGITIMEQVNSRS